MNDEIIDQILSQKEWKDKLKNTIYFYMKKYPDNLKNYTYVYKPKTLISGGYIKYINKNDQLKGAYIYIKTIKKYNKTELLLKTLEGNYFKILFENNFVFFRKHLTAGDKLKDIFITFIDKNS